MTVATKLTAAEKAVWLRFMREGWEPALAWIQMQDLFSRLEAFPQPPLRRD